MNAIPLRVDFAGGWLDHPAYARSGGYIVNCAISPLVTADDWPYELGGGLGGSAAKAFLDGRDGVATELDAGVGWQDPAVIRETGLCVWHSGPAPRLYLRSSGQQLTGRIGLVWTGRPHVAADIASMPRDYDAIEAAGAIAADAVRRESYRMLCDAVAASYQAQLAEGMPPLPRRSKALAMKYGGAGWGGYAIYLFPDAAARAASVVIPIEPYAR